MMWLLFSLVTTYGQFTMNFTTHALTYPAHWVPVHTYITHVKN